MKFIPYLNLNGQCAAAFTFYEKCLGGTITFSQTFAESPMKDQVAPEWQDKIMHCTLSVGDNLLMGADAPPEHETRPHGITKPQAISISLSGLAAADGERVCAALSEGGSVGMPFQKTYWAAGFGMVTDRFGISWMVNCE